MSSKAMSLRKLTPTTPSKTYCKQRSVKSMVTDEGSTKGQLKFNKRSMKGQQGVNDWSQEVSMQEFKGSYSFK